jgi:G3E family GTPase
MAAASQGELRDRLEALNAGAPVVAADHGRVDPKLIFDADLYDPKTKSVDVLSWLAKDSSRPLSHDADIQAHAIVRDKPIGAVTLTLFLEALAEHCGADLLRLKGMVCVAESPDRPAVVHGVQHVFHAPAWLDRWPSDDRSSRMVFITRRVPRRWLEVLLEAIEAEVSDVQ